MNVGEKLFDVFEGDALVLEFCGKVFQRFLPNAGDINVAMKVGGGICLVFYSSTEGFHESQDASGDMAVVAKVITALTVGAVKTHADAEQFREHATHHWLETKHNSPRITRCQLLAGGVRRYVDVDFGGFPERGLGCAVTRPATGIGLSIPAEFHAKTIVSGSWRNGDKEWLPHFHACSKQKTADAASSFDCAGDIGLDAADVL